MNAKTLLRISISPVLIKLVGHSIGHAGWDKPADPKMKEIVATMKGYTGKFMGADYNMAAYFTGYSLMILCVYALTCYLLWAIADLFTSQPNMANKIVLPVAFIFFAFGILEIMYFFPFAASMSFLAGMLMILSVAIGKK